MEGVGYASPCLGSHEHEHETFRGEKRGREATSRARGRRAKDFPGGLQLDLAQLGKGLSCRWIRIQTCDPPPRSSYLQQEDGWSTSASHRDAGLCQRNLALSRHLPSSTRYHKIAAPCRGRRFAFSTYVYFYLIPNWPRKLFTAPCCAGGTNVFTASCTAGAACWMNSCTGAAAAGAAGAFHTGAGAAFCGAGAD